MNRGDAYALLSRTLHTWQQRPYDQLAALVGQPARESVVRLGEEEVTIRVRVIRAHGTREALRIEAAAEGPSSWRLERLEESAVVAAPGHLAGSGGGGKSGRPSAGAGV